MTCHRCGCEVPNPDDRDACSPTQCMANLKRRIAELETQIEQLLLVNKFVWSMMGAAMVEG